MKKGSGSVKRHARRYVYLWNQVTYNLDSVVLRETKKIPWNNRALWKKVEVMHIGQNAPFVVRLACSFWKQNSVMDKA